MSHEREWDESYLRRENHVFVASDEVVRFVARHLRRRVGLDEIIDVLPGASGSRVLDLGCGIGRHLVFGTEMGLEMYGLDLSPVAVTSAVTWLGRLVGEVAAERVVAGDARSLPWADGYFAHAMSDSALDSMPAEVTVAAVEELARVVRPGGLLYASLVDAGDGPARDEVVQTPHERDTVQAYFDRDRIDSLLGGGFELVQRSLVRSLDDLTGTSVGRWHVVARRR